MSNARTHAICERVVLVIEPNGDQRRQLTQMLYELKHHDVYAVDDSRCALSAAQKKCFDVVFCAYAIPGIENGGQLLEQIVQISELPPAQLVLVDRKPIFDLKISGKKMARMLQRPFTIADVQRVLPYPTMRPGDFYKRA